MPELPETETIARDLDTMLRGARLLGARVSRADVLRELPADRWDDAVRGLAVGRVWRRAKLVVLDLVRADSQGDAHEPAPDHHRAVHAHLVVQPRFTGALLVDDGTLEPALREYACIALPLADGRTLYYRDVRRLGTVALMTPDRFVAYTGALGREPLAADFTATDLREALGMSDRPLKAALMDQTRLAGVGNIYATEACWSARLDPSRRASSLAEHEWTRLHEVLVQILTASIAARGTSFRDYRDASGGRGAFVAQLAAYGRAGAPCPRCGRRLVGTDAIDGRATVLCAWCQR